MNPPPRRPRAPWTSLLALLLTACGMVVPPAVEPMPTLADQPLGPERAVGVLVLLPGVGDRAATFEEQGVLVSVAELAPRFDVIAADAHYGYYLADSVQQRLEVDVIAPARAAGYRQVWLLGVSLGAFGALAHAAEHPDTVDGVVLLGPYLGDVAAEDSLLAAPSLAAWDPATLEGDGDWPALMRRVWTWLQQQTGPEGRSVVLMGYGDRDGPGTLDEQLARALPPSHFVQRPGGHAWSVWRPLIRDLLPVMAERAEQRAADD